MKRFYSLIILLCISFAVRAQNFNLLDINKSTDAYPQNYQQTIAKNQFAVLDNIVSYFEANDGIHGGELWRSDGTPGGTFMVKDIVPGQGWSNPADIITSGERIFFSANDYMQGPGNELWTSDGTKAGTKKLSGVSSDNSSANPTDLTDVNGTVYFFTDYGSSTGSELWKSDGTNAGTQKIVNFYKSDYGFGNSAQAMENVNGRLFFALFTKNNGFQLWTSDGTKAGTIQLTTINTGNYWGCTPFNLTAVNGLLYFGLDDGTGDRLYVSDGTIAGTQPVKNAADFYLIRNNIPFTVRYNNIFFGINTSDNNGELCKLNATGNKIEVVKFLGYGNDPDNITNVNNTIFFTAWNGSDYSLFKTDGTDAGTVLVKDANPGGTNWYTNFTAAKNKLLYSYFDDTNGFELWESDGTEAGTNIVKDIYPGIYSCSSNNLTYVNGFILFGANDGINGQELWKSDGTAAGTFLLKNINNTATSSSDPFSANGYNTYGLQGIVSPSNQLLFNATNVQYGNDELFTSDGTAAGTHLVKDINTGSDGSYPQYFVNLNSKTYFIAELNGFTRIWQTDGTNAGTSTISVPALDYEPGYIVTMVATSDLLYIETFNSSTYQYEIWRSDGTSDGTYIVQYLSTYYGVNMTPVDDKLFFSYFDTNTYTWELWKTDGSTAGTNLLNNAYSNYYNLVAYNNKLYFAAYDASYNYILGTSNGTQAGTKILKYIYVDNNFKPTVANGK
ncbi:MAG TPA: ELWxxDGT repeat protein, partial [Parafilimonas sp.]|nr:ELWxxDGT repeat protein [Parafilimonas sp.]